MVPMANPRAGLAEMPEVLVRYLWGWPPMREALWPLQAVLR
jgi:hypothetical protein